MIKKKSSPYFQNNFYNQLIIVVIGIILFIPFLGNVHLFDWDEINFAESAREMILSGNYLDVQINFIPFKEKPPLFIWLQVLSMKLFGINEFAARFPNSIVGIVTLLVVYNIGKRIHNMRFGLLWAGVYVASLLPYFYFKSGIIDPLFNLFIFLGIYFFTVFSSQSTDDKILKPVILSAIFIGLGILTKGPVAFLLFFLTAFIYMIMNRSYIKFLQIKVIVTYVLFVGLVGGFWFFLQILNGNYNILLKFYEYQVYLFSHKGAGHGGFLFYHFIILFIGVFPASVFAIWAFRVTEKKDTDYFQFKLWMLILFWVVLILFTIVKTKIVHYSSMCYFPLTFLSAFVIDEILEKKQKFSLWMKVISVFLAIVLGGTIILLQLVEKNKAWVIEKNIIKDKFVVANLQANVHWSGFEFLIGILLIVGVLFSVFYLKNTKYQIGGIFISNLLFTVLSMIVIIPLIEQYSQKASIDFFKELSSKDCYVETYRFRSYAKYFYFDKKAPSSIKLHDKRWLLKGDIDKDVYIICKNYRANEFMNKYKNFKKIKELNGFVFFKRERVGSERDGHF